MVDISQSDLTASQCSKMLDYNATTGRLTWAVRPKQSRIAPGADVGSIHRDGYQYVTIGLRMRLAHRIVWLMTYGEWPQGYVDHINRVRHDNRVRNLRLATPSESSRNTSSMKGSSSRFLGVCRNKTGWQASIRIGKNARYLGTFQTEEEAAAVYAAEAKKLFGEFSGA